MKTIIITGASSGIGKETAIKFKNEGYNVVGTYLNSKAQAIEIEREYGIKFIRCDISKKEDIENLFSYTLKTFGRVDVVVANAGLALAQKPFIDVCDDEIDSLIAVNLKGTLLTNKCAVLSMLNGGGKIINVSSVFGLYGGGCEVIYSVTKSGIIGLTKSLAEELSFSNIEVCAVAPGLVDTKMNSHLSKEDKERFIEEIGVSKVATPKEIADFIYKISITDKVNGEIYKIFC